jgi:hypothetical protein
LAHAISDALDIVSQFQVTVESHTEALNIKLFAVGARLFRVAIFHWHGLTHQLLSVTNTYLLSVH